MQCVAGASPFDFWYRIGTGTHILWTKIKIYTYFLINNDYLTTSVADPDDFCPAPDP